MRTFVLVCIGALLLAFVDDSARAESRALDQWFLKATAYYSQGTAQAMARPDFICGKTFETMACHLETEPKYVKSPLLPGLFELLRYDRKHHVAVAFASTDQESYALFSAPAPPVSVPNADLSQLTTGRGLRIGSPYAKVLSLYGGTPKHGQRFVTIDTAHFPTFDRMIKRWETLEEIVTLVIANGRVSSIAIRIDCCNG